MEARPAKWLARSMQQNRGLVAAGTGGAWRRADRVARVAGLVAAVMVKVVVMGKVVVMERVGLNKRVNIKKRLGNEKTGSRTAQGHNWNPKARA